MPVSPEKIKQLEKRLVLLGIYENDLTERFVRSQGSGGQKVNKTSSCVYLRHEPTGIEVKCQEDRSQAMNRFFARRILADRIEEFILGRKPERIERIRKQKKRRARRSSPKPAIICEA